MSARYVLEDGWKFPSSISLGEGAETLESSVLVLLPLVFGRDISVKKALQECGGANSDARGVFSALLGGVGGKIPCG